MVALLVLLWTKIGQNEFVKAFLVSVEKCFSLLEILGKIHFARLYFGK